MLITLATIVLTRSIYCQEENKWPSWGSGQDIIVSTITCTPSSALARQSSAPAGLVARHQNICSSLASSTRRSDRGYGLSTRPWPRSSSTALRTYSGRSPSLWRLGCPSDDREEEEETLITELFYFYLRKKVVRKKKHGLGHPYWFRYPLVSVFI